MRLIDRFTRPVPVPSRAGAVSLEQLFRRGVSSSFADRQFETYTEEGLKGNSPIFSLVQIRARAFSEFVPKWQNLSDQRLFGSPLLQPLERPVGTGLRTLMKQVEVDKSMAGNAYLFRPDDGAGRRMVQRLRPDWVDIVASPDGSMVAGYRYWEGGRKTGTPRDLAAYEVAHLIEMPDPMHPWKGMSWITAVAREVDADTAMSKHKNAFFANAATPNLLVKIEGELDPEFREVLRGEFSRRYEGVQNAYKTAIVDQGADVMVLGRDFQQMEFALTQAAGEARLAAAANVPAQIAGFSKGLDSSTYTNYTQAMRRFADLFARPAWGDFCESVERIFPPPSGARLWYEDRHIPFLQQDAADEAVIRKEDALTMEALIRAGYEPDSVTSAVTSGDFTTLAHSGLVSVQLQPPGSASLSSTPTEE